MLGEHGRRWLWRTFTLKKREGHHIGVWNRSGLISFAPFPTQRKQRPMRQELSGTMPKEHMNGQSKSTTPQDSWCPFIFAIKDTYTHPENDFGDHWIPMYHSVLSRSLPATTCRRWHWSRLQWPQWGAGCTDNMSCWPKITCISIASVTFAVGVPQKSGELLKKVWVSQYILV